MSIEQARVIDDIRVDVEWDQLQESYQHWETLNAMRNHGGSFVKHLAEAWFRADYWNNIVLREAFSDYYERYAAMAKQHHNAAYLKLSEGK